MFHQFQESKNFMHERGTSRFLSNFFLCRTSKKLRRGILLCFRNFLIWRNFLDERVGRGWSITSLRQKFFVAQCRKMSEENLSVFFSISGIEILYE